MAERSGPETVAERPLSFGLAPAEFALALGGFALGTGKSASMGLLPDIARSAGVSIPTAGMAISTYALDVVVGAPLIAVVFAKVGRRTMLVALMLAFALASVMTALSTAFGTVVLARFLAGLPHGAYFGFAALAAATMAPPSGRAKAIGCVMLGLSAANIAGVPIATWIGDRLSWNAAFAVVAVIALATAFLAQLCLPPMPPHAHASPLGKLRGMHQSQLWLTLGIAAIGFGGLFAVYSYVSPTLMQVTGVTEAAVPLFLAVIGTGMVGGSLFGGWLADRGPLRAIGVILLMNILVLAALPLTAFSPTLIGINLFLMGFAALSLAPALQARLMDVAGLAQALAASLNHSVFNIANAFGAWLGGVCVAAGFGWTYTGPLGACLAAGGLLILLASGQAERRSKGSLPSGA